jgi:dTDP-4-amino-4,6-dideoxygalactose transaminase
MYGLPRRVPALHLGETLYHEPTRPSGLSGAAAGILSRSFTLALAAVETRRETAGRLANVLSARDDIQVLRPVKGCRSSYLRLPALLNDETARAALEDGARVGIAPGYPRTLPDLVQARPLALNETDGFPGATELVGRLFTFATHTRVGRRGIRLVEGWVQGAW